MNLLTLLIPTILMLASMPLLVRWLTIEVFGLWILCSTLLGFVGIFDFGLKEATISSIPKYLADSDQEGLLVFLQCVLLINLVISSIFSLILYFSADLIALKVFQVEAKSLADAASAFKILSYGIFPSIMVNTLSAIAMGYQRFDLSSSFILLRNVSITIATLFIAAKTSRLSPIIMFSVTVSWICIVLGLAVLNKVAPIVNILCSPISMKELKKVLSFGLFSFSSNISMLSMGVFDKILIGVLFGPASVSYYSVPLSLTARAEQALVKFAQVLFPKFSEISSQNSSANNESNQIFDHSINFMIFISIGGGILVIMSAESLLTIWMGESFASQSVWILRGLMAGFLFRMISITPSFISYSLGKPSLNTIAYSLSGALYLLLIMCGSKYSDLGTLSFSSLSYIIAFLILFNGIGSKLNQNMLSHVFPFLTAGALSALLGASASNALGAVGVSSFLIAAATYSLSYLVLSFLLSYLMQHFFWQSTNSIMFFYGKYFKH